MTNPVCHSFLCVTVTTPRKRKMMQSEREASVFTPYFTVVYDLADMLGKAYRFCTMPQPMRLMMPDLRGPIQ